MLGVKQDTVETEVQETVEQLTPFTFTEGDKSTIPKLTPETVMLVAPVGAILAETL